MNVYLICCNGNVEAAVLDSLALAEETLTNLKQKDSNAWDILSLPVTLPKNFPKKTFYVAYSNTDLTEGRGQDIPIGICRLEATALRIAKKQYVQGTDGPVRPTEVLLIDNRYYISANNVQIVEPTQSDKEYQAKLDASKDALEQLRRAGFTDEQITNLKNALSHAVVHK